MKAPENTRNWLKVLAMYQAIALLIVLVLRTYAEDPQPFFKSLAVSLLFTNCISLLIEGVNYFKPQLNHDIYTPITFAAFRRHLSIVYFGMFVGSEVAMVLIDKILNIRFFLFFSLAHLMLQKMNLVVSVVIVVIMAAFYQLRGRLAIKDRGHSRRLWYIQCSGAVERYAKGVSGHPGEWGSHGRYNCRRYDRAFETRVGVT